MACFCCDKNVVSTYPDFENEKHLRRLIKKREKYLHNIYIPKIKTITQTMDTIKKE